MANDDPFKGYERDISAELKEMFYNRVAAIKERTTEVKIKAIKAKVDEHDGLLVGLFKQLTVSLSPFVRLDEKIKENGKKKK